MWQGAPCYDLDQAVAMIPLSFQADTALQVTH